MRIIACIFSRGVSSIRENQQKRNNETLTASSAVRCFYQMDGTEKNQRLGVFLPLVNDTINRVPPRYVSRCACLVCVVCFCMSVCPRVFVRIPSLSGFLSYPRVLLSSLSMPSHFMTVWWIVPLRLKFVLG